VSTENGPPSERGYQRVSMGISQSGQWQENATYELWVKESREVDRKVHACLVSGKQQYQWKLTVYVGNKETWSRESAMRISGTDCIVSGSLPEGTLGYAVSFSYWQ
jgi:phenolic acid decarboxylase